MAAADGPLGVMTGARALSTAAATPGTAGLRQHGAGAPAMVWGAVAAPPPDGPPTGASTGGADATTDANETTGSVEVATASASPRVEGAGDDASSASCDEADDSTTQGTTPSDAGPMSPGGLCPTVVVQPPPGETEFGSTQRRAHRPVPNLARRRSSSAPSSLMSEVLRMRELARPLRCLLPLRKMRRGEEMRCREPPAVQQALRKPLGAVDQAWPPPKHIADDESTPRAPHYQIARGHPRDLRSAGSSGSAGSGGSGGPRARAPAAALPPAKPERSTNIARNSTAVYIRDTADTRLHGVLNNSLGAAGGGKAAPGSPAPSANVHKTPPQFEADGGGGGGSGSSDDDDGDARRTSGASGDKGKGPCENGGAGAGSGASTLTYQLHEDTLLFDSKFESGNLSRAAQVGKSVYELFVDYDVGTKSHSQWFYFSIANVRPQRPYTFHIMNFLKSNSLYNNGMRVLYHVPGTGWRRGGEHIQYYANQMHGNAHGADRTYYTLSFTLTFTDEEVCGGGKIYIAHCQPYTYSDLREYLSGLERLPATRQFCRRKEMWRTLAGNAVDVVTITGYAPTPEQLAARPGVFISARVHPGESNSSYVVKGVMDYLTSHHPRAQELRNKVVFKIVPMLNPDGVISGNYRCALGGHDLNRKWGRPCEATHPEVYNAKHILQEFSEERDVMLFIDVHGHSRKPGAFMYGCGGLAERVFPKILSDVCPLFIYNSCSFCVAWAKRNTARVVGFRELGINNSYTLEISFGGSTSEHFTTCDLEDAGRALCDSVATYLDEHARAQVLHSLLNLRDTTEKDEVGSDDSVSDGDEAPTLPRANYANAQSRYRGSAASGNSGASSPLLAEAAGGGGRRGSVAMDPTGVPEQVVGLTQKPKPPKKRGAARGKRRPARKVP